MKALCVFQASAGQRILTLEELSKQPVNQHRPIIVINTTIEYELYFKTNVYQIVNPYHVAVAKVYCYCCC